MMGYIIPRRQSFVPLWIATINLFMWFNLSTARANEPLWLTAGNLKVTEAKISPDGKLLAYLKTNLDKQELYIKYLNDKGSGIAVDTVSGKLDNLAFSSDSQMLAFSKVINNKSKIFLKKLRDTKEPAQITFGDGNDYHPSFSSDGKSLAFDSDRGGNFDIFLLDLKTKNIKQVTDWSGHDFSPSFSADNEWLTYTSARANNFQIFMKNLKVDASMPIQLTQFDAVSTNPYFASDYKGIFFDSNLEGKSKIFFISLDDYKVYRIASVAGKASKASFAKDNLVFLSEESGVFGVRKLEITNLPKGFFEISNIDNLSSAKNVEIPVFETEIAKIANINILNNQEEKPGFSGYDFDLSFLEEKPITSDTIAFSPLEEVTPKKEIAAVEEPKEEPKEEPLTNSYLVDSEINLAMKPKKDVLEEHFTPKRESIILKTIPNHLASDVELYSPISFILRSEVNQLSKSLLEPKLLADEQAIAIKTIYNQAQNRIDIIPNQSLKPGTNYKVVAGYETLEFKTVGEKESLIPQKSNVVAKAENNLKLPLRVARVYPADKTKNIKVTAPIRIMFNQKIMPESVAMDSLQLFYRDQLVPGEMIFENSDQELSLKPYHNLLEASVYEIRLSKNLKAFDGSPIDAMTRFKFKTQHFTPFLISELPNGVINDPDKPIIIRFNRPIDQRSLIKDEFQLRDKMGKIESKIELQNRNLILAITPWQRLTDNQDYMLYLSPNLRDSDGNLLQDIRPISLATRFHEKLIEPEKVPIQNDQFQQNNQDIISFLGTLFQQGSLKSISALNLVNGRDEPTRFKVALVIEEALGEISSLNQNQKKQLLSLANNYKNELNNLGVDLRKYNNTPRLTNPNIREANRLPNRLPMHNTSGEQQSSINNDFVSRARQI